MKRIYVTAGLLMIIFSSALYAGQRPRCLIFEVEDTLAGPNAVPGHLSASGKILVAGMSNEDEQDLLYQWTRNTLEDDWAGPTLIEGAVNETADSVSNMQPTISNDGLMLVYTRNKGGGWEANDLWMATRPSTDAPFDNVRPLTELNTPDDAEAYPYIAGSGSKLYYTSGSKIMAAQYDKEKKEFIKATEVIIEDFESAIACWVSADEKTILVSDGSAISLGERSSVKKPFKKTETLTLEGVDAFISGPSLDAAGDLYIYISASNPAIYDYEEEDYSDEVSSDEEDLEDSYEEPETIQAIIRLTCSEGE